MVDEPASTGQAVNQLPCAQHLGVVEVAHLVLAFGAWTRGEDDDSIFALQEDASKPLGDAISSLILGLDEFIEPLESVGCHHIGHVVEVLAQRSKGGPVGDIMGLDIDNELVSPQGGICGVFVQRCFGWDLVELATPYFVKREQRGGGPLPARPVVGRGHAQAGGVLSPLTKHPRSRTELLWAERRRRVLLGAPPLQEYRKLGPPWGKFQHHDYVSPF